MCPFYSEGLVYILADLWLESIWWQRLILYCRLLLPVVLASTGTLSRVPVPVPRTTWWRVEGGRLGRHVRHLFYSSSLGWVCRSPPTPISALNLSPTFQRYHLTCDSLRHKMTSHRTDYLRKRDVLFSISAVIKIIL